MSFLSLLHYPSPRTKLASLVKGEVLSPERIRATTGGIATPPSLACTNPPELALSFEKHNILASLVKGEVLSPEKIRATNGGIASPPSLASHQPSQTRTIPRLAPHSCHMNALPVSHPSETLGVQLRASMPVPCQRELDCDKAISYYKLQHSAISSTLIFAQPYLSQD